ncbi:hypothetical protein [Colwellia sp. MEBiC06753]
MSFITRIKQLFAPKTSNQSIGIAFRQDAIAYCLSRTGNNYDYQQFPINDGVWTSSLNKLLSASTLTGRAQISLAPNQYQIVQVEKPNVPDDEVPSALKWQIKDLVTIAPEDMIVDYFSGAPTTSSIEKINVVCASKSTLKVLVEQLNQSNIELTSIITEEFAFANLLPFTEQAVMLLCQQPNEEVIILIVKNGRIYFHRRLRGYAQLSTKSMEELSTGVIDALSLEIQRSSDYFERQLKQAPIREIQVILPMKTEHYIVSKLAENTNTPVKCFEFDAVHTDKAMYAAAIGVCQGITQGITAEANVNA